MGDSLDSSPPDYLSGGHPIVLGTGVEPISVNYLTDVMKFLDIL